LCRYLLGIFVHYEAVVQYVLVEARNKSFLSTISTLLASLPHRGTTSVEFSEMILDGWC